MNKIPFVIGDTGTLRSIIGPVYNCLGLAGAFQGLVGAS